METKHQAPSPESLEHGHEVSDVRIRGFVWFVVIFIAVAVVLHVLLWGLYGAFARRQTPGNLSPLAIFNRPPPSPQLQASQIHPTSPRDDMDTYRRREDAMLSSYGWIDRDAGVARVPIEVAMQLTLQRGLPVTRPAVQPSP